MTKRICEDETTLTEDMLGKTIHLYCCRYIYRGRVLAVDATTVLLTDACIVYETGPLHTAAKDAQKLPSDHRVMLASVESWGEVPDA